MPRATSKTPADFQANSSPNTTVCCETKQPPENIDYFLQIAKLHVTTLMLQGMQTDATSCLLIMLCTADIHSATSKDEHAARIMDLLVLMLISMTEQANKLPPTPEISEHAAPMLAYSALLLTHFHKKAESTKNTANDHLFAAAEQMMKQLGNIPTDDPTMLIDGNIPNPENPKTILAEIIGHASAIGMLQF